MENCVEMEIHLIGLIAGAGDADGADPKTQEYLVQMRYSDPNAANREREELGRIKIDYADFVKLEESRAVKMADKAPEFGRRLASLLFEAPALKNYLEEKRKILADQDQKSGATSALRIVLSFDASTPELHGLRWETLADYRDQSWLLSEQNIWFSRFLPSASDEYPSLRPRRELSILVAIASPADITETEETYLSGPPARERLFPIKVSGEVQRARLALAPLISTDPERLQVLARSDTDPQPVSLNRLAQALRQGCDIFYLACHGAMDPRVTPHRPVLLLEDETTAKGVLTPAKALVDRLRDVPANRRPRLILLASCESSSTGETSDASSALQAIGPELAKLGIPAVIAMQGKISMKTVETFMPAFFTELVKHGQVDLALTVARAAVKDRPDAWMPVLYLGLKDGRLWYDPGFSAAEQDFKPWPGILASIQNSQCLPVLGYGLAEFLSGSPGNLARSWGKSYGYPLTANSSEELPQVAQYVASQIGGSSAARIELLKFIKARLREGFGELLPADAPGRPLRELLPILGAARRQKDPYDPYRVLARLPFPIYLNTTVDNFLESALTEAGKTPRSLYFPWRTNLQTRVENIQAAKNLQPPDPDHPLVYYLFGTIQEPDTLVLTEDDYFDFMMWVNKTDAPVQMPDPILDAWKNSALLFLGFQLTDWNFRLLFRSILNEERRQARANAGFHSVAVQLQPASDLLSPTRARQYLEKYLPQGFDIYYGKPEDFLHQLWDEWEQQGVI